MMKNKIVYFGSSDFAVPALEKLNNNYEIVTVVVQPDKRSGRGNKLKFLPVKQKALELGLNVFQPENVSNLESENYLKSLDPDLFVVCSYGQILKKNILGIPKNGSLNIHGSILPKYRGASPVNQAIIDGDDITGNTIMILDEGMDTGDILKSSEIIINDKKTAGVLFEELANDGADLLLEVLPDYLDNKISPIKQDSSKATYTSKISKSNCRIDWNRPAKEVLRFINGLDPIPSAFTNYNNKKIKLFSPKIIEVEDDLEPGTIISANSKDKFIVKCKDNALIFDEIQFPGKKRMKASDFFRGNKIDLDIKLN